MYECYDLYRSTIKEIIFNDETIVGCTFSQWSDNNFYLTQDGRVYCYGTNRYGMLGLSNTNYIHKPKINEFLTSKNLHGLKRVKNARSFKKN